MAFRRSISFRAGVAALLVGLAAVTVRAVAAPPAGEADGDRQVAPLEADGPLGVAGGELDVWVASTRGLPGVCATPEHSDLAIERLCDDDGCHRWERGDLPDLLAAAGRPLVIFVHGNRYDSDDAKAQGLALARRLAGHTPAGPPPRLVILSWPSRKQGLPLKDARLKFQRAHADGHYLAWLLGQVEPEQPVAIISYSLGALLAAEALDKVADRDLAQAPGVRWADRPGRTHLVLVAPALRADALGPRGRFRRTIAGIDRITLLINSRDTALRFFPLVDPNSSAAALGLVGMPRRWLPAEVEYDAVDASGVVGKLHSMQRYLGSRSLSGRIAAGALDGLGQP